VGKGRGLSVRGPSTYCVDQVLAIGVESLHEDLVTCHMICDMLLTVCTNHMRYLHFVFYLLQK
jgi:hypothetical protein